MIHLRYHEGDWRYDFESGYLTTKILNPILLCSERRPLMDGQPIYRKGEHEWIVAPVFYRGLTFRHVPDGEFILLGNTPNDVCECFRLILGLA